MRGFFKFLGWVFGVIAAICLLLYIALLDVWAMPTDDAKMSVSTLPTMTGGDLVILSRHGSPERGDLVRCADPQAPGRFIVARLEGKTGEKIDIVDEVPMIDGTRTPSPHACETAITTMTSPDTQEEVELACSFEDLGGQTYQAYRCRVRPEAATHWTVEKDRIYLVSDNRHMHVDSRDYGTIDPATCKHVLFRLWSKDGPGDSKHRFNILL